MISESMAICLGLLVRAYLPYFLNIYIFKQGSFHFKFKTNVKSKVQKKRKKVVKWASSVFLSSYCGPSERKLLWTRK